MYKPISTSGEWVVVHNANYNRFAYLNDTVNFRTIGSQGGGTAADPTDNVLTLYDLGLLCLAKIIFVMPGLIFPECRDLADMKDLVLQATMYT